MSHLSFPDDDRQIRVMNRTPNIISHSALPLQSPFEQPPIYTPPQIQTQWPAAADGSTPSSSVTSLVQPSQAFSPHHPLRPIGGPVSTGDDVGGMTMESPMGLSSGATSATSAWGRHWARRISGSTVASASRSQRQSEARSNHESASGQQPQPVRAATWETQTSSPSSRGSSRTRTRSTREEIERVPIPRVPVPALPADVVVQQQQQQQLQQQQQQQQQQQRRQHREQQPHQQREHRHRQHRQQNTPSSANTASPPVRPPILISASVRSSPAERSETMSSLGKTAEVVSQYEMAGVGLGVSGSGGGGGGQGTSTTKQGRRPSRWRKWSSPGIMTACLLGAVALSLGHHGYYTWLDGRTVGDVNDQQWTLRLGNLFAVGVGLTLKVAVGNAYFQFLWGHLKRTAVSLRALDNLFDATGNLIAIFNPEIITKATIGFFLVALLWLLPLVSVFPAATLSVTLGIASHNLTFPVLVPSIGQAIDIAINRSPYLWVEYPNRQTPSPLMNRIIQVATFNGELAPPALLSDDLQRLDANLTYQVEAYVPRLKCSESYGLDSEAGQLFLAQAKNILQNNIGTDLDEDSLVINDDLSFTYDSLSVLSSKVAATKYNGTFFYAGLVSVFEYPDSTLNSDNVLVLTPPTTKYVTSIDAAATNNTFPDGSLLFALAMPSPSPPAFITCSTYNTSVVASVDVTSSRASRVSVLSTIDSPSPMNFTTLGCLAGAYLGACPQMAYQFWLSSLVPYISGLWWSPGANDLSLDATPHQTGLVASRDLWDMLERVSASYDGANPWDISRTRADLTFAAAIEELSLNVSLSFMSEPTLSTETQTSATALSTQQVYIYRPQNLVISYGLGVALTFCALLYGIFTYAQNGRISYDNLFTSIAGAAQHPTMARLPADRQLDSTEVDRSIYESRWRLGGYSVPEGQRRDGGDDGKRFGFVPIGPAGERAAV